ncbi:MULTISPECIES: hypothetical protein [Fischerella]|uniref:hypothetical protein n=1 Tax=Fischerella TaxID=1190 RepID=UPI0003054D38|nr:MULTISPECIES: hypothetical protein [Fischerella]MBD2434085.1 hypothetical protein [Fischerella sp. FACHB-380]
MKGYISRRQKAEGRRQKAEGRRQKAKGRRQKAEGRRQKAEGMRIFYLPLSSYLPIHLNELISLPLQPETS